MMNRFVFFLVGLGFWLTAAVGSTEGLPETPKIIGITQIVEHPALDAVRLGLLESLAEQGFHVDKNLRVHYENAQGNLVTATQIASKLLSTRQDVIVAISTPSAQTLFYSAQRNHQRVPIVFAAVNDPVVAKLEGGESHYPITGVTDTPDVAAVLNLMRSLLPIKTLGLLYNASEPNSVATITRFKALLLKEGIGVREMTVSSTTEVPQALHALLGNVDALYFPQDNTVVSAIETVVSIANQSTTPSSMLPVFCSDPLLVERGVLAAVGYDYKTVGREAGVMVGTLLKGGDIQKIPVRHPTTLQTVINKPLAERLKNLKNIDVRQVK